MEAVFAGDEGGHALIVERYSRRKAARRVLPDAITKNSIGLHHLRALARRTGFPPTTNRKDIADISATTRHVGERGSFNSLLLQQEEPTRGAPQGAAPGSS